ncbi:MAG: LD-carboxypeptidase [Desulfobacteraceae bacterium]|nr:LD-carboxypeptidase [Desulfobacteraceae bacterium]
MLKHGDIIGVCAPSGSFDNQKFEKGLEVIKEMGFNPIVPKDIYSKKRYLAGNDPVRAEVITNFFIDKNVKAIMCARGGFGAIRILDLLDWNTIQKNPKVFIGFSDITALLINLAKLPLMKAIHGPTITTLAKAEKKTKDSLYQLLTHGSKGMQVNNPVVINKGSCKGKLIGGNLATMNHLVGTKYQTEFKDCVLFIEDTGEAPYKIDRMLTQMKMADCFQGIKGIVAGSFKGCENFDMVLEIIQEIFDEYQVPIIAGIDSGHGRVNLSIPLGVEVQFDTDRAELEWNI